MKNNFDNVKKKPNILQIKHLKCVKDHLNPNLLKLYHGNYGASLCIFTASVAGWCSASVCIP